MSQYPSPYQPQYPLNFDYFQAAHPDLLAPARRAAIMLFIVAALSMLCGGFLFVFAFVAPMGQIIAQAQAKFPQLQAGTGSLEETFKLMYVILGTGGFLVGAAIAVLGFFVRKGRQWACIAGIVICLLLMAFLALNIVGTVFQTGGNPAMLVGGLCVGSVPGTLLTLTMIWLIQAARVAPRLRELEQQYQMQWWQYQQQQAAYGGQPNAAAPPTSAWQSGYGVTPPVVPPPPPPAPPNDVSPPPPPA